MNDEPAPKVYQLWRGVSDDGDRVQQRGADADAAMQHAIAVDSDNDAACDGYGVLIFGDVEQRPVNGKS